MKNNINKPMSATIAIAALLALSSTPLAAQSADPAVPAPPPIVSPEPIVIVPIMPTASPVPVLVIPQNVPENVPENVIVGPVVQPLPVPSPAASASAGTAPRTTSARTTTAPADTPVASTARTTARAAPLAAPAEPALATQSDPTLAGDGLSAEAASPVIGEPRPAVAPTPEQSADVTSLIAVGLLGMLAAAIALFGFLAFRRRRPFTAKPEPAVAPVIRVAPRETETVAAEQPVAAVPAVATPLIATPLIATPAAFKRPSVAGALPSEGAAVDLPAEMPNTFDGRNELLWRMIDARPDKANPFTDRRARLHRARLIMQSLSRTFDREPQIDLSQYPNNWPELARPQYKAA